MKKLIYCALALAAGLFATSCMQENLEPVQEGNTVTFKVSLPEVATKAFDDGREVIDDLVYAVYRTTATTEAAAFADYENYQLVYQVNPEQQTGFSNGSTTVELELINDQNYVILFWAQNFDAGVYNTTDLRNVSYATEKFNALKANEGAYAAFSGRAFIEKVKGTSVQSVTLYRPFAQINIGTADPEKYDVQVLKTAVSVSRAGAGFNVADQTALESTTTPYVVEFEAAAMPEGEKLTVGTTEYHSCVNNEGKSEEEKLNHHYVAMNYIFAKETVAVTYAIETTFGTVTNTIDNVPVKTNYRTNIIGNLLTSDVKYDVTLDKDWGTPDKNVEVISVASADEIVEAIKNASADKETNIKLEENIDLGTLSQLVNTKSSAQPTGNSVIVIPENRSIVVDLNGCKLNAPYRQNSTTNHYYAFENYGTLTIVDSKGNGAINSRGNFNYGTMILESGTIDAIDGNGGYGVRNYEGAEFVMNGGKVATTYDDGDIPGVGIDATPIRVDQGAKAEINGGTINNICNYTFAIDNAGTVTINGGTFTTVHTTVGNYASMTINGGSFTCNGLEGISAHALWAAGGTTTINGGTFKGKDKYNGFNVDASKGATVYIKGGEFLPVHSGSLYGDGTIIVTGGTFFDQVPAKYLAAGYSCEENEEGKWIVPQVALAKIGEVSYPTLAVAIDDVSEDAPATITVQAAVFTDEPIVIPTGKSITLDLNGMSITGKMHKSVGAVVKNEGTLTIKNGTISSTAANGGSAVANNGTLTIEKATLNGAGHADGQWPSYTVNNTGVMTATETKITSYHGALASYGESAKATLDKSVIDMVGIPGFTSHGIYTYNGGQVVVNGGTYENKATDQAASGASVINGAVEVNAGTVTGRIENYYGTPVLKGGTYSVDPTRFVAAGYKAVKNDETALWDVVAKVYVAEVVGGEQYETLQEAVKNVSTAATIKLLTDIEQTDGVLITDKNLIIDLDSKTFTVTEGSSTNNRNFKINGSSVVTIKNGTMVADGNYSSGAYGTVRTEGTANVTLTNVKLYNYRGNGLNVKALSGTTVTISDTEVYSEYGGGIESAGGTIELTNVKVEQKGMYTAPYNSMAISVNGGGTVTVNSGTYSTKCITAEEANNQGTSHGPWCAGVLNSGGTLIINGGTFSNDNFGDNSLATYARGLIFGDTASKIVINEGTFNALKSIIDYQNNLGVQPNPNIIINGGNFSADPSVVTSYGGVVIKKGYAPTKGANDRWTLVKVQQNNEIWYTATALVHAHFYKDKFGEGTDLVSNEYDEATGKGVITLSGPVTKIGSNAFYQNVGDPCHLTSITLPNTVTEIGEDAFDKCINLTTVKFSENLVTIGPGAFGGCEKLTNVTLPEGLITIGDNAFDSCSAMTSVVIPSTVTSIGMSAFISGNQDEKKIYCKPTIPPTVGYRPFNIWYAEIYVPTASLAAYQKAWGSIADNIYDGKF